MKSQSLDDINGDDDEEKDNIIKTGQVSPVSTCSLDVFPHQVGGHHVIVKHPTRPDLIVKPFFPKEIKFYESAAQNHNRQLRNVISKYHGQIHLQNHGGDCIVLEDLTFGMVEPCIMDVKIGRRLYDDDATLEKIERMIRKSANSTSATIGFRISGMRYVDGVDEEIVLKLKPDMKGLKMEELLPTMKHFFCKLSNLDLTTLTNNYLERLSLIREAVLKSNGHFYSSSILFVYDHDDPQIWDCRMIDFVHCTILPFETIDENYLEGLDNLILYFKKFLSPPQ